MAIDVTLNVEIIDTHNNLMCVFVRVCVRARASVCV